MSHAPVTDLDPSPPPLLVSAKEAARQLGLSRSRVYELMDSGLLPSGRIGRRRVIPADALTELVAKLREG